LVPMTTMMIDESIHVDVSHGVETIMAADGGGLLQVLLVLNLVVELDVLAVANGTVVSLFAGAAVAL
jgi:hypothetical protein